MSLKELRELLARVDDAIAHRTLVDREDLKKELTELAKSAGYSLDELFGEHENDKKR